METRTVPFRLEHNDKYVQFAFTQEAIQRKQAEAELFNWPIVHKHLNNMN